MMESVCEDFLTFSEVCLLCRCHSESFCTYEQTLSPNLGKEMYAQEKFIIIISTSQGIVEKEHFFLNCPHLHHHQFE